MSHGPTLEEALAHGGGDIAGTRGRTLEERLHNDLQRGFPLVDRPFAAVAALLGASEIAVLATLGRGIEEGRVSRVGAVFAPRRVGASTLAAMAVPPERLAAVAARVGAAREVNHSYEREHAYNLWFVATAADEAALARALGAIASDVRLPVLSLPLVAEYHIDLGFDLVAPPAARAPRSPTHHGHDRVSLAPADRALVAALAPGLPLVSQPFAALARAAGWEDGRAVRARLAAWLMDGTLRRLGVVLHHRALGFVANAMCVWDVPDADVDALGAALATEPDVTLCYRRRRTEGWRFNLFCMIHGRARSEVEAAIAALRARHGLGRYPHAVLFSRRAFKQRGADYGAAPASLPLPQVQAHG